MNNTKFASMLNHTLYNYNVLYCRFVMLVENHAQWQLSAAKTKYVGQHFLKNIDSLTLRTRVKPIQLFKEKCLSIG